MGQDVGSASVEFALVLPAMVVVLAWCLGAAGWALQAAQAQRIAAEGARVAITDNDQSVRQFVTQLGAPGVSVTRQNQTVTVCVPVPARMLLPAGHRCATAWDRP